MKSFFVKSLLSLAMALFCGITVYGTSYTWTGSTSRAWNTTTNWNPNGLPDSLDNVTIVTTTNTPLLSQNRKVNTLTMTSGTLDLAGYQLLSASDSSTLEEIALKTWIEAGNAIYVAAAMIGIEIHPTIAELRLSNNEHLDSIVSPKTNTLIFIHPNPATNSLTISGIGNNTSVLQTYDMQGKLVYHKEVSEDTTIDISKLIIGIYRINVIANGNSSSFKFIKMKY